jgi:sugar phosphate isomerase/epimerase
VKVGLYSITYLGVWYKGPALDWKQFLHKAKSLGFDGVEFDGKRPHANPMDLDQRGREAIRNEAAKLGLEIPAVSGNNDFSSPVPEHREAMLLMVREQARMTADLGAKVLRLFAAWPGITFRNGQSLYEEARQGWERAFPDVPRLERWGYVRECLKEAAAFGEEFGVVMALQNHAPLIRHWKDTYDLVREVNSPWLKMCWDVPIEPNQSDAWLWDAGKAIGAAKLQVHSHFGGEFLRDAKGVVQLKSIHYGVPLTNYPTFLKIMKDMGYDGYFTYEFCHPAVDEYHNPAGIELIDQQVAMALEYMRDRIAEVEK